jgi:hypothetical protein
MNISLSKFDMSSIEFNKIDTHRTTGPVIIMIGRRGTGKSYLIKDLLYFHKEIPSGVCISGTEISNGFFNEFIPSMFIHNEYNPHTIVNIIRRQADMLKLLKQRKKMYGNVDDTDPRAFLIMDDCLYDNSWVKEKAIRFIFTAGRHVRVIFILTSQYPLGIPPLLRTNIDYVFILKDPVVRNRKILHENYAGMVPFEVFNKMMDDCTKDFGCLVINNMSPSNNITDQIFWYKAENRPSYRIGSREVWELSEQMERDNPNKNDICTLFADEQPVIKKGSKINIKRVGASW